MAEEYCNCPSSSYSTFLVTCPVISVKLQIANYFLLTANPINEISSTIIGLAVSKKLFAICNLTLVTGQVTSSVLYTCFPNLTLTLTISSSAPWSFLHGVFHNKEGGEFQLIFAYCSQHGSLVIRSFL